MVDETGNLKSNVALQRVEPGSHGVSNWYDRMDTPEDNVVKYLKTKYGANTNLVAQASTRTVSGRNDYDYINLFKHFDANVHLDENGNTIIDAIRGDKNFSYTGKVDVVCVFGIAQKGNATLTPFFYLAGFPNSSIFVALNGTFHQSG